MRRMTGAGFLRAPSAHSPRKDTQKTVDFFLRLLYEAGLAGRIGNVHISDYDFIDERHELPGNGKNDWPAIIAGLEKLDYDGPFLYEPHANSPGRAVITPAMVAESRDRLLGEGV